MVRFLGVLVFLMSSVIAFGQTAAVNDYRSNVTTGSWSAAGSWQRCSGAGNPGTWVAATVAPSGTAASVGVITIRTGHTITFNNSFTVDQVVVAGTLNISAAITMTLNNGTGTDLTVSLGGAMTNSGTLTQPTGAAISVAGTLTNNNTINLNGNSTTNVAGTLTNNGIINQNNTSTSSIAGQLTNSAAGNFNVASGASFNIASGKTLTNDGTITIAGATLSTVNGTLKNTGTITSTQANLSFLAGSTYDHAFTTIPGNIPVALWNATSTCLISSYTTNTTYPGNLNSAFGNFTWNTPAMAQDVNLSGRFATINGTLTVSSTGAYTLYFSQNSNENFVNFGVMVIGGDLIISGTSSVNITKDVTASTLTIGGSLNHSSASTLNVANGAGSIDINIGGDVIDVGALNAGPGTLTLNGTGAQSITGAGVVTLNNITVSNTSGSAINLNSTVNMSGVLTLTDPSNVFNANGTGSGMLTLLSTGDKPTADASIAAIPSGATFTGSVTVQRFMGNSGGVRMFRYLSSPVQNATVADWQDDFSVTGAFTGASTTDPSNGSNVVCGFTIQPNKSSMYYYDASTQAYVGYPTTSSSAPLVPMQGYSAQVRDCSSPVVIDVTGQINQGDQIFSLINGGPSTYNLVGNPYPSAIDWGSVTLPPEVGTIIAIADNAAGNGNISYHYMDNSDGAGVNFVALGQGFWVNTVGASPSFTLTEDTKAAPGSSVNFYRTTSPANDKLTIAVTNGSLIDKAFVKFNNSASNARDRFDGPKLANTFFNISTLSSDNVQMAVNSLNTVSCGSPIKINSAGLIAGTYSISFLQEGRFAGYALSLVDTYTNTTTPITSQPYSFTVVNANAGSKAANRFQILVAEKPYSVSLPVTPSSNVCGVDNATVSISNTEAGVLYVAQLAGISVSDTLAGNSGTLDLKIASNNLSEGENTIVIKVLGTCSSAELSQSSAITKNSLYTVGQFSSTTACNIGTVTINATGAPADGHYNWYGPNDTTPISGETSYTYTTPSLQTTTAYSVSIVNGLGCEGAKTAIDAKVSNYQNASIVQPDGQTLQSNYSKGNHWYLDDQVLSDTTQSIKITRSGTYKLLVNIGTCSSTTEELINLVTGIEPSSDAGIKGYPNPVESLYTLELPASQSGINELPIFNSLGGQVGTIYLSERANNKIGGAFDFTSHSSGLYLIRISSGSNTLNLKVVKK